MDKGAEEEANEEFSEKEEKNSGHGEEIEEKLKKLNKADNTTMIVHGP